MASETPPAETPPEESTSTNPATATAGPVPAPPREQTPGKYFQWVNKSVLGLLGIWSKQALDEVSPRVAEKKQEFANFLDYLERCRQAYPNTLPSELVSVDLALARLKGGLQIVYNDQKAPLQLYFSDDDKDRARAFHDWAEQADVQPAVSPATSNGDTAVAAVAAAVTASTSNGRSRQRRSPASDNAGYSVRLPPVDHPIWGIRSIMHGVALTGQNGKTQCFDPRYKSEQRSAAVFGHNGLAVGNWFASQIRAVYCGAHGSSEGGIHSRKDKGAYSVIVTSTYDDVDEDHGDVLYYSGSRALENTNPLQCAPRSAGTTALHVSYQSGRVLRVLRKASAKGKYAAWAPDCGIRYDGLYRITRCGTKKNQKGGLYEQFKLVREPNQTPLEDLTSIPSLAQRNDYARIGEGFVPVQ
ncbi:hypothetical protein CkaCkLH20_03564 [Colletotrichum karsti]|uniref:YDG domain-containing protein n=1 Tax=Colletotrichum karsti TaxID=1095194 RepID=A0A9P6I9X6_9PEZI|nr:uncharacterized protein CkaCkLH20_03564 [Colletotrichum karsti]KAF9878664.1 hypothetical protein CkaCkLH20_03564 [Colletotrichum karsti]